MRFVLALAAPVFPLLALLCCFLVELMKPGLGITAALQAVCFWRTSHAARNGLFPALCLLRIPSQPVKSQPCMSHRQALTLFYVGGASSTSTLLRCQRKDGGGDAWWHRSCAGFRGR